MFRTLSPLAVCLLCAALATPVLADEAGDGAGALPVAEPDAAAERFGGYEARPARAFRSNASGVRETARRNA